MRFLLPRPCVPFVVNVGCKSLVVHRQSMTIACINSDLAKEMVSNMRFRGEVVR